MKPVIETENLSKRYGNIIALNKVNLQIKEGDIYGLIGRNGAGKSSLLRVLCGQSTQYSGNVKLFGRNIKQDFEERKKIGTLIEYPAFYPELTGRQNLEYYRIQKGISQKSRIQRVLHDLDLIQLADRKFKQYSLGNKQRLGIALALLNEPKVLILDEPTNGLDPFGIKEIRNFLLAINKTYNTTILISSHILSELEQLITKVGFIDKGNVIEELSIEDLRKKCSRSIHIKVSRPDKIYPLLKEQLLQCQVTRSDHSNIKISGDYIDISELSTIVSTANEKILTVNECADTLEDYFINLIGGADHEQIPKKRTV